MPYGYGDSVVLVKKSPDGKISRVNALVVNSTIQPEGATRANGLRDNKGGVLPAGEYLDLFFPRDFPNGQPPKACEVDTIIQKTYQTPEWKDGSWIGWQKGSATAVEPEPTPPLPSSADLDAVATEQKVAEETSGSPTGKKSRWGK